MRKALFFDIDGTIWDDDRWIPDSTREAFRKMKERGHYLFISSGRTRVFIPDRELMPLGFDGILAGCGTYGEFRGEVIFYHQIPRVDILHVNDILRSVNAAYVLEGRYFLYLDEERFPGESSFPKRIKGEMGEKLIRVTGNEKRLEVSKFCANYLEDAQKQKELEILWKLFQRDIIKPQEYGKSAACWGLLMKIPIRLATVQMIWICWNTRRILSLWEMGCRRQRRRRNM